MLGKTPLKTLNMVAIVQNRTDQTLFNKEYRMGVQLNSSKFKSNDLTRMMPVSSEPFKTLQIAPKFKQPPSVPCCGIVHELRFRRPQTAFARLSSA